MIASFPWKIQTSEFMIDISFVWSNSESKIVSLPSSTPVYKQKLGLRIWDLSQTFIVLFSKKEKTEGVVTKVNGIGPSR